MGGTGFTVQMAIKHKKPVMVFDFQKKFMPESVLDWAKIHKIRILNVAGPRESRIPGIHEKAKNFLKSILVSKE